MTRAGLIHVLLAQAVRAGDLFAEALTRLIVAVESSGSKLTDAGWVTVGMVESWRRIRNAEEVLVLWEERRGTDDASRL